MKRIGSFLSVLVLLGSVGVSAASAAGGVLLQERSKAANYCHMKFPAISERTLAGDNPVLKSASSGDVIDFYGSCDENPLGKDQVVSQRIENARHPVTEFYAK